MKIAVVSNGIWPDKIGGIQKHSYELVLSLAERGLEVGVFFPIENPDYMNKFFKENFRNVYLFPVQISALPTLFPGHYLFNLFLRSRKIRHALINSPFQPDFVLTQGLIGWGFRNIPFKTISHLHGLEMFQKSYSLKEIISKVPFQWISKSIIKHSDYQCYFGPYTANLLKELGSKRLIPFPNAIRLERNAPFTVSTEYLASNKKPISFVYLGRYEFRKGIHLLTKILRELLENFQFEFHFIGDIPAKVQLIHPQIFYHGKIQEERKIRLILQKSEVLVLPSFAEGMPTCILEAMSEKTAIIATKVGENSLLVCESNGWIIDPHQESSLKQAMEEALNCDYKTLKEKAEKSYQMVIKKYTWEKVIRNFLNHL